MHLFHIALFSLLLNFHPEKEIPSKDLSSNYSSPIESLYEEIASNSSNLPQQEVFEYAVKGWEQLESNISNQLITIIDFSLPSTEKRLWVIDPINKLVLVNSVVSHGRNSGELYATNFSNKPSSYKSSLGFYKTAETYHGKHGLSLRLDGLEKGFNDLARPRAIVIHGADYAREEFISAAGRLGRSLGCPALPSELSKEVIELIKEGSLLFIYGEDQNYLSNSKLISASFSKQG